MHSLRNILPDLLRSDNNSGLARALGISRSTLARYQKNPDVMPVGLLKRVADINGYKVRIEPKTQTYTL